MSNPQDKNPQSPESPKVVKQELTYEPRRANMIAANAAREPANVKIRARSTIAITADITLAPGEEAFVTETQAKEFCRVIKGQYAFSGERQGNDTPRHQIQRAERVA